MPAFTTHYLFGVDAYKRITDHSLKRTLRRHHCVYSLGMQGPDVFFYFFPSYLLHRHNLGALAHISDTRAFYANLLESRKLFAKDPIKQEIADAYLLGFLGHYSLDCTAHPYIYAFTNYDPGQKRPHSEYFGQHAYLETEVDNALLLMKKHLHPSEFHQDATIHLSRAERNVIAHMLSYAYGHTYHRYFAPAWLIHNACGWMEQLTRTMHDPTGQKKVLSRFAERHVFGHPYLSALIASDHYRFVDDPLNEQRKIWKHPWTGAASNETFLDLYKKAGVLYDSRLKLYLAMMADNFSKESCQALLNAHGNCSFLSGLPNC